MTDEKLQQVLKDLRDYRSHTTITVSKAGLYAAITVQTLSDIGTVSMVIEGGAHTAHGYNSPKEARQSYERSVEQLQSIAGDKVIWSGRPLYG